MKINWVRMSANGCKIMAGIEIKLNIKEILRTNHNGGNLENCGFLYVYV